MMTQEEYMNVKALRAAGWTIKQIADHLGFHPATVSSWLRNGGPPPKRSAPVNDLVIDERWQARISALRPARACIDWTNACARGRRGSPRRRRGA